MKQLSKELLESTIADWEAARDEIPFGLGEEGDNTLAALKFALAGMAKEPVAYADPQAFLNFQAGTAKKEWMWCRPGPDLRPLYAAPPAPVIPDTWIPCSERMPDVGDEYYLTHSNAGVDVTYFCGGKFYDEYATHWQPLPAPPKEV